MSDQEAQKSVGDPLVAPPALSPGQEELCKRLDELHAGYGLKTKPSDMFRGAVFTADPLVQRSNPDWLAQAANSLREILYPFYSREVKSVPTDKKEVLEKFGSVRAGDAGINELGRVYNLLSGLTHHGNSDKSRVDPATFTVKDFGVLLNDFEKVAKELLSRQLDIHKEVDEFLKRAPAGTAAENQARI